MKCNHDCFNCIHSDCIVESRTSCTTYYLRNKSEIQEYQKTYRENNHEQVIQMQKDCYQRYKDKRKLEAKLYRQTHADEIRIKNAERYKKRKAEKLLQTNI